MSKQKQIDRNYISRKNKNKLIVIEKNRKYKSNNNLFIEGNQIQIKKNEGKQFDKANHQL
jgi:hypothetical protein